MIGEGSPGIGRICEVDVRGRSKRLRYHVARCGKLRLLVVGGQRRDVGHNKESERQHPTPAYRSYRAGVSCGCRSLWTRMETVQAPPKRRNIPKWLLPA